VREGESVSANKQDYKSREKREKETGKKYLIVGESIHDLTPSAFQKRVSILMS